MDAGIILIMVVVVALLFDFTNGFHDTANSIATLVGTRAVAPQVAVLMAAALNFVGAFWSLEVAATVGKGIVDPNAMGGNLNVVLAGLLGAIVWNLVTWYYGIPSSSSHALVGGLVGAMLAFTGPGGVLWNGVIQKVLLPSLIAPTLGFLGGLLIMAILMRMVKKANPQKGNKAFRRLQIFSGGWLSFTHGTNDAQKTMGIIGLALLTANGGSADQFEVPMWVVFSAASAMALGTYAGGWKIIKTLGGKVVKMSPMQGFAASSAAATVLQFAAVSGVPVSTTHCTSGCVMGAGAAKRLSAVRWTVAGEMATAWVFTLPAAAIVGFVSYIITAISPLLIIAIAAGFAVFLRHQQKNGRVAAH